jgi:hypothetical protein
VSRVVTVMLFSLAACLALTGCGGSYTTTTSSISAVLYRGHVYTSTDEVTVRWGGGANPQSPDGFTKAGRGWGLEGGPVTYSKAFSVLVYTIAGQPTRISCDDVLAGGGNAVWIVYQLNPKAQCKP